MKTRYWKTDWLVPLAGVAVVAGCLMAATTYFRLERTAQAADALGATIDHLFEDQRLSMVLNRIHGGEVDGAAQHLDQLLCGDILRLNAGLESADAQTRAYVEDAFRRIARLRPKTGEGVAGVSTPAYSADQAAAERILALALGGDLGRKVQ
jgi:hypothetical protein